MKISIKEFREIVRQELAEMKLGVAGSRAPEPDRSERPSRSIEDLSKLLLKFTDNAFSDKMKASEKAGVESQEWHMHNGQDPDWDNVVKMPPLPTGKKVDETIAWLGESEITPDETHREQAGKRKEKAAQPFSYIDRVADMSLDVNKEDLGDDTSLPPWEHDEK